MRTRGLHVLLAFIILLLRELERGLHCRVVDAGDAGDARPLGWLDEEPRAVQVGGEHKARHPMKHGAPHRLERLVTRARISRCEAQLETDGIRLAGCDRNCGWSVPRVRRAQPGRGQHRHAHLAVGGGPWCRRGCKRRVLLSESVTHIEEGILPVARPLVRPGLGGNHPLVRVAVAQVLEHRTPGLEGRGVRVQGGHQQRRLVLHHAHELDKPVPGANVGVIPHDAFEACGRVAV